MKIDFYYAIISVESKMCTGVMSLQWELNKDYLVSIGCNIADYIGKYYYDSQWFTRVWSEVDENGEPSEGATYTDVPWKNED